MDIKEVIKSFEDERKFLLKDLSEYKFTMTEILINQILRIKSITRVLRELKSNNLSLLENYETERANILSEIENEKIPLPQNFLEPVHRLKIIKNVLEMTGEDNKVNNKDYIG